MNASIPLPGGDSPSAAPPPAHIDDGIDHPFPEISVTVGRIAGFVTTGILVASLGIFLLFAAIAGLRGLPLAGFIAAIGAVAAIGAALAWSWPKTAWQHRSWRIDADAIRIRGGVVWQSEVSVPRSRVQHIDVAQGPIQRMYGLANLVIHTAGTAHSQVPLDGLPHDVALQIRDLLVQAGDDDAV